MCLAKYIYKKHTYNDNDANLIKQKWRQGYQILLNFNGDQSFIGDRALR